MTHDSQLLSILTREFEQEKIITAWRKQFPEWNTDNIETLGIISKETFTFAFVYKKHPAIAVLRHNKLEIGMDVDTMPLINGEYFKVDKILLGMCYATIRALVYNVSYPVRPRLILKLQRWAREQPSKRHEARTLALFMACHPRVGASCALQALDADTLRLLSELAI